MINSVDMNTNFIYLFVKNLHIFFTFDCSQSKDTISHWEDPMQKKAIRLSQIQLKSTNNKIH
jgi:hypothetical protein